MLANTNTRCLNAVLTSARRATFTSRRAASSSSMNDTRANAFTIIQQTSQETISWRLASTEKPETVKHAASTVNIATRIASYILPAGYPSSVSPSYTPYAIASTAGVVVSAAGGGLGAGALPLAAGINWVLKDGLGQLGGVLCAALINTRFDADPKRWRFLSALLLDSASALEIATAFHPSLFLPVAAVANVLKNVAWLSSSATRASIHQAMSRTGNLADVTAKSGSQTIGAATLGTALGVAISSYLGQGPEHLAAIATAFGCLSVANLALVHRSLSAAVLPTLSPSRLYMACEASLAVGTLDSLPSPSVLSPERVGRGERFLPFHTDAVRGTGMDISVGTPIDRLPELPEFAQLGSAGSNAALASTPPTAPGCKHMLVLTPGGAVHLLLLQDAGWRDQLLGHMHALRVRRCVQQAMLKSGDRPPLADRVSLVRDGFAWLDRHGPQLVADLEQAGWWIGTPLLETEASRRVQLA